MANYSTLKAAVADVVKTNGNRAITGANLQSVLLSIINSLGGGGYIFKGVATPSTNAGTPDENVFYIGGAGTYANFGTSVTVPVGSICVFKYNGSWTKEQIALFAGIDAVPTAGSDNLVKSGGVYMSEKLTSFSVGTSEYFTASIETWQNNASITDVDSNILGKSKKIKRVDFHIQSTSANTLNFSIRLYNRISSFHAGDIINLAACIYTDSDVSTTLFFAYYYGPSFDYTDFTVLSPSKATISKGFNYLYTSIRCNRDYSFDGNSFIQIYFKDNSLDGVTWFVEPLWYIGSPYQKFFDNGIIDNYKYKGIATPQTIPVGEKSFYFVNNNGLYEWTYPYFVDSNENALTLQGGEIAIFKYDGGISSKDILQTVDKEFNEDSPNPVQSTGIAQSVNKVALDHPINQYWQSTDLTYWGDTTQSKVVSDVFGYEREVDRLVLTANTSSNTFGFDIFARLADGSGYYDIDAYIYSPADAGLVTFRLYTNNVEAELFNRYVYIKEGVNTFKFRVKMTVSETIGVYDRLTVFCNALKGQTIYSYYNYYKNDNLNVSFINFFGSRLSVLDPTNDKDFASCAAIGNYVSGITGNLNKYVQYTDDIWFRKEGVSQQISCDANGEFIGEVTSSEVASVRATNGFYVPITYSSLDFEGSTISVKVDLTEYLNESQVTIGGFVGIVANVGDWAPANKPVRVNLSQVTGGFNIFDAVKEYGITEYTDYYKNANLCYVVIAGYVPVEDKLPYKVGVKAYVKKSLSGVVDIDEFNGLESRVENLEDEVGNTSNVVCWGDSLTAGAGSSNTTNASTVKAVIEAKGYTLSSNTYNYVSMLQTLLGSEYTVYNKGVGGENINAIAARQGGNNALLSGAVQLPANTSAVNINIPVSSYDRTSQVKVLLQGGQNSVNTCYVQGIPCTLSVTYDSGFTNIQYKLNRVQSGNRAVTLPQYTPIVMAGSALNPITAMAVIWCWQNGGYNSDSELVDRLKNMISHLNTTKYILIGLHSGTESSRNAQEALLEKTFGDKFFNWRQYASTNALYDFNITPTSADTTAMQSGSMPPSLLSDAVHLNSAGYMILGWKLFERMQNIGYIR